MKQIKPYYTRGILEKAEKRISNSIIPTLVNYRLLQSINVKWSPDGGLSVVTSDRTVESSVLDSAFMTGITLI